MLLAPGIPVEQIETEPIVELRRRHRLVESGPDDEVADVGVGFEQHGGREQDVVDPNHAFFVQLDVVHERRAAVQREIQRVVQVVIEVRAGGDDEVDEPAVHQLDDAAAEPGRRQRPGEGQPDRRVLVGRQHLLGVDLRGLREAAGVERLKSLVDEMADLRAALRPVVADGFAGQNLLAGTPGRAGGTMRQELGSFLSAMKVRIA